MESVSPFLRFCCFTYVLTPIHTANLQAISAIGKSDIYLRLEIEKKVIGVLLLGIMFPHGIYAMMIGTCICDVLAMFINIKPNKILIDYGIKEQMKDLLPIAMCSMIMGGIVWGLGELFAIPRYLKVLIQVTIGCIAYVGLSKTFCPKILKYFIELLLSMRGKRYDRKRN